MLRRVREIGVAVLISATVIIGFLLILPQFQEPSEFEWDELSWAVSIGETYQFDFESWVYQYPGDNYSFYSYYSGVTYPGEIPSLNGTTINVTITFLPSLSPINDRNSFETEIIECSKIECVFENGSSLPDFSSGLITEIVSSSILPTGSWSTINASFPSRIDVGYGSQDRYYLELTNESSQFGFLYVGIDWVKEWKAIVSLESGFPSSVTWSYEHLGTGINIKLTKRE